MELLPSADSREIENRVNAGDLLKYVSLKPLNAEVRAEITRQATITGSAVQRWLAEFDAKRRAPLDIDWCAVASAGGDDKESADE